MVIFGCLLESPGAESLKIRHQILVGYFPELKV
jgi:hypothetical protein